MPSPEALQATSTCVVEPVSSPSRVSFSAEFLDDNEFISIFPDRQAEKERERAVTNANFEFLSGDLTNMITADKLFCEGKLLPFWQTQTADKLDKLSVRAENTDETERSKEESRISLFLDDDPSPRPPKCTVLWKELLRWKKHRASTSSPSSSSSFSSRSSSSPGKSQAEMTSADDRKEGLGGNKVNVKRAKKGLERTRSFGIKTRSLIYVPICSQRENTALPPSFPNRRGRLES